jgi:predicted nucleic acid-binding protein
MSTMANKFCLDANVLIQAWQNYYNPKFCSGYWEILNELGEKDKIFIPELVFEEITRTEDALSLWLRSCKIPVYSITEAVADCLKRIYSANPNHKNLVDNIRGRSLADPWVIAHALNENAVVVTKEEKQTKSNSNRIKIPNVCDNMGIPWINDFQLVEELGIRFQCTLV